MKKRNKIFLTIAILSIILIFATMYKYKTRLNGVITDGHASRNVILNSAIEKYVGTIRLEDIEKMVKIINIYNADDYFPEDISIENESDLLVEQEDGQYKIVNKGKLNKIYKVEMTQYDDTYGYIKTITISEAE